MTVKELMKKLSKFDSNEEVYLIDEELLTVDEVMNVPYQPIGRVFIGHIYKENKESE